VSILPDLGIFCEHVESNLIFFSASADQVPVSLHEGSATEKRKPGRLKSGQDGIGLGRDDLSDVGGTMALILFEEIDVLLDHDKG
jgi:hypothetical protein